MRTIAVVNLKGGSGKTTTALSLAVGMARHLPKRKRLLMIDGDSQANASFTMLDGQAAAAPTLGEVLLDEVKITDAIRASRVDRIDILPSDSELADDQVWLADQIGREQRLATALKTVEKVYDLVVIDAPPQLSLVSVNILRAVTELIVPVDAGIYSAMGLSRLQETVEKVRRHLAHPDLAIIGLVVTRAMPNRATKDLVAQLRKTYGALVYGTVIPYSAKVEEAHARNRTVLEYAPTSPAAVAFEALIKEVMNHGRKTRGNARKPHRLDGAA
jgi:chromosome partitioning protein